jgi:hypothetical protein
MPSVAAKSDSADLDSDRSRHPFSPRRSFSSLRPTAEPAVNPGQGSGGTFLWPLASRAIRLHIFEVNIQVTTHGGVGLEV